MHRLAADRSEDDGVPAAVTPGADHDQLGVLGRLEEGPRGAAFDDDLVDRLDESVGVGFCDQAIDQLWMAFQPIVNWKKREIVGYEALVRSHSEALGSPGPLLSAAERLGRVGELGQRIRRHVVDAVTAAPVETLIFMNLHAADLNDDTLYSRSSALYGCVTSGACSSGT